MKMALQALVTLAAAATPQIEGRHSASGGFAVPAVLTTPVENAKNSAQARLAQRQIADFDEKRQRLTDVEERLEDIVALVVQMSPEEMEILDPVLLELFSKREQLVEAIEAGRDGLNKGVIDADEQVGVLQEVMELELAALEDAVEYLSGALAEYAGQGPVIEI